VQYCKSHVVPLLNGSGTVHLVARPEHVQLEQPSGSRSTSVRFSMSLSLRLGQDVLLFCSNEASGRGHQRLPMNHFQGSETVDLMLL
jgi:hypothetical protein